MWPPFSHEGEAMTTPTIWVLITLNLPPTGFEMIVAQVAFDQQRDCLQMLEVLTTANIRGVPPITGKCQPVQLPQGFRMVPQN
jgi:hypothetical protein